MYGGKKNNTRKKYIDGPLEKGKRNTGTIELEFKDGSFLDTETISLTSKEQIINLMEGIMKKRRN